MRTKFRRSPVGSSNTSVLSEFTCSAPLAVAITDRIAIWISVSYFRTMHHRSYTVQAFTSLFGVLGVAVDVIPFAARDFETARETGSRIASCNCAARRKTALSWQKSGGVNMPAGLSKRLRI